MKGGDPHSHTADRTNAALERAGAAPDGSEAELGVLRARCAELERQNEALRRTGEQLARERDDYRRRYDELPIASATLDPSGTVIEANPALAALLHLEPTATAGVNLETAIAVPQHVQRFRDHLVSVFRSPAVHGCELWLRRPDGGVTRVRIESSAQPGGSPPRCRSVIYEVTLPSAHTQPPPARTAPSTPPAHGGAISERGDRTSLGRAPRATILVVEDESLVRKAVQHYLSGAGYRVLTAIDGNGALERAEHHDGAIDLILTDLSLPSGGTGPEVAMRIKERRPRAGVLYMSACPPELLARRGFTLQPGEALEKPFSKEALLARVATALERAAARTATGTSESGKGPRPDGETG